MDAEAYFERVVRFLETKGWNTSRTQINRRIFIVTGSRKSDTYYDRMLTMVGIDDGMTLTPKHIEYLVNAGAENDVDHLMATARGGLDEEAATLAAEHGIEFIDTETIDDAFIDEFSIEDGGGMFEQARARRNDGGLFPASSFRLSVTYPLSLYLLAGLLFGAFVIALELAGDNGALTGILVPGAVLLVAPALAALAGVSLAVGQPTDRRSLSGLLFGTLSGYLLLFLLLGVSAEAVGLVGSTELFTSQTIALAVVFFAVPTALLGVGVAHLHTWSLSDRSGE